jgi:hypothetical protein
LWELAVLFTVSFLFWADAHGGSADFAIVRAEGLLFFSILPFVFAVVHAACGRTGSPGTAERGSPIGPRPLFPLPFLRFELAVECESADSEKAEASQI